MINGKKVEIIIFVGREAYMKCMLPYLLKDIELIDRISMVFHTWKESDRRYIQSLPSTNPKFRLIHGFESLSFNQCWVPDFFSDPDTVYVKVDDDVVYIEDGTLTELIDFTLNHEQYFCVTPLVINSWFGGYALQEGRMLSHPSIVFKNIPNTIIGNDFIYNNGNAALFYHTCLLNMLESSPDRKCYFHTDNLELDTRWNINMICIDGVKMKKMFEDNGGSMNELDEIYLSYRYPHLHGMKTCMMGSKVISHYSFKFQRSVMDQKSNLLERYYNLSNVNCHV